MAGPWEKYATEAEVSGPWSKYQAQELPSSTGVAERFLKGASATGYRGAMGVKRALLEIGRAHV